MFDVIVVGAGPSGATAALHLARAGARVLLLEKYALPRVKPCGGGLPHGVTNLVSGFPVQARIPQIRTMFNIDAPHTATAAEPIIMVRRSDFDAYLVEIALHAAPGSVELRDNCPIDRVTEDDDGVSVSGPGGLHERARYLVAADGVLGVCRRSLGMPRRLKPVGAIDIEVEVDAETFAEEASRATFNFGCVPDGYGWIFPKDGYLTCGVGSWRGRSSLPHLLDSFLAASFPGRPVRVLSRVGYPIPLYSGTMPVATPRVCFVGDAAALVDPVMGEGIRFAIRSGSIAAETIASLLGTATVRASRGCLAYQDAIDQGIGCHFETLLRIVTPVFMQNPRFFHRKFFEDGANYFKMAAIVSEMAQVGASPPVHSHATDAA